MDRSRAMGLMARASRQELAHLWASFGMGIEPALLAGPETGMVRLSTQAGASPVIFQFGEATCTRAVVALGMLRGYAVHLGSDSEKARLAACLDLLLQRGNVALVTALETIAKAQAEQKAERARLADATRVRFFTTKTST